MRVQSRKITQRVVAMIAAMAMLVSCVSEDADFGENDNESSSDIIVDATSVGYLSMASLNLAVNYEIEDLEEDMSGDIETQSVATRADEGSVALDDYRVILTNSSGKVIFNKSYSDVKSDTSTIELTADYYTIQVMSHETIPASGSYPCYASSGGDSDTYAIGDDKTVSISNQVVCKLANIKTTVSLSADLLSLFKPADEIDESLGEKALMATLTYGSESITFDETEIGSKVGYFAKNTTTDKIGISLTGMYNTASADSEPNYTLITWSETVTSVDSGQARQISIKIDNYNDGKLTCLFEVESWIEQSTLGVDIQSKTILFYQAGEEEIPDADEDAGADESDSDENSPEVLITIGGTAFNTNGEYSFDSSIFDYDFQTYTNPIMGYVTPYTGMSVSSVTLNITSTNSDFTQQLVDDGYTNGSVSLWSNSAANSDLSKYFTMVKDSYGVIKVLVTYEGMLFLERYKGKHTFLIKAVGSDGLKSYTSFVVNVTSTSSLGITWQVGTDGTIYDFNTRYRIYTSAEITASETSAETDPSVTVLANPEIVLNITSGTGITGLSVKISGDVLTPTELGSFNLAQEMDLINPATDEMAAVLDDLGFPVGDDIYGDTARVFDITEFMPILAAVYVSGYESGAELNTTFTISVTDDSGTVERTIQVYQIQQ